MGMSASQARLLSITARLTDNELRSQTITNSKLRLAEKSSKASQEYMNALNSEKLTFRYYNDNGESTSYNLTPALLYSYEPLKNQYSLQNASGQNLVSATDAANFEKSDNLEEFLNLYGLVSSTNLNSEYENKLAKYNKYLEDFTAWTTANSNYQTYQVELDKYNKDYVEWQEKHSNWEVENKIYEDELKEWEEFNNSTDLAKEFTSIVGTSEDPKSCYKNALEGDTVCYVHVLAHLLDYTGGNTASDKIYTTSTGATTNKLSNNDIVKSKLHDQGLSPKFKQISEALNNKKIVCDGNDDINSKTQVNSLKDLRNSNKEPQAIDKLKSDYIETQNEDGTYSYSLKTVKQKAIDLLYLLQNNMIQKTEMQETLKNFTDGDMQKLTKEKPQQPVEPQEPSKPVYVAPPEAEPEKVEKPVKNAFDFTINDKDKGQWYINLWYMMNGSETANKIKSNTNSNEETIYGIENNVKNLSAQNYKVIEDELLTSTDWLQFALKNGIVTLSQASYYNPAEDSGKTAEYSAEGFYWSQKPYSNASDIISVQDDAAIARAEVKYKNATTEIENKDKKYDQDLKKLDTQHTALQTEYESLKNVIDKNVERSFKAFS